MVGMMVAAAASPPCGKDSKNGKFAAAGWVMSIHGMTPRNSQVRDAPLGQLLKGCWRVISIPLGKVTIYYCGSTA